MGEGLMWVTSFWYWWEKINGRGAKVGEDSGVKRQSLSESEALPQDEEAEEEGWCWESKEEQLERAGLGGKE
jgi:hypothetical protein